MPAHAANLIKNGGFELGPNPGARMSLASGSTAIQSWTVMTAAIDYVGTEWAAEEGAKSVALNGTTPGGIAQSFATISGAPYTVKFFQSGDPNIEPFIMTLRVSAAGQHQDFSFDAEHVWPWGMGWAENTFAFTANAATTTLQFTSLIAGANGPAIDSVVVTGPSPVGVDGDADVSFVLAAPFPNPTAGAFSVVFALPVAIDDLRLSVLDARGREVRVLASGALEPGVFARTWDGTTDAGGRAASGVYFVRLAAPGRGLELVRKGILLP
jgi:choice-of-anchor C domain-containing protein